MATPWQDYNVAVYILHLLCFPSCHSTYQSCVQLAHKRVRPVDAPRCLAHHTAVGRARPSIAGVARSICTGGVPVRRDTVDKMCRVTGGVEQQVGALERRKVLRRPVFEGHRCVVGLLGYVEMPLDAIIGKAVLDEQHHQRATTAWSHACKCTWSQHLSSSLYLRQRLGQAWSAPD